MLLQQHLKSPLLIPKPMLLRLPPLVWRSLNPSAKGCIVRCYRSWLTASIGLSFSKRILTYLLTEQIYRLKFRLRQHGNGIELMPPIALNYRFHPLSALLPLFFFKLIYSHFHKAIRLHSCSDIIYIVFRCFTKNSLV